jgi:hypothetical protein
MSNENGVLRKLLWLYLSFPYYAVSLALGARIIGDGFLSWILWVISLSVQAVFPYDDWVGEVYPQTIKK